MLTEEFSGTSLTIRGSRDTTLRIDNLGSEISCPLRTLDVYKPLYSLGCNGLCGRLEQDGPAVSIGQPPDRQLTCCRALTEDNLLPVFSLSDFVKSASNNNRHLTAALPTTLKIPTPTN